MAELTINPAEIAEALKRNVAGFTAGVSTELHVYRGAFHGFDRMAPDSAVGRLAWRH